MSIKNGDMRKVLASILYGSASNPPEGHPIILRKMRKDSSNRLVPCPFSNSKLAKQQNHSSECEICSGEGFIWDEYWVITYARHNSLGNETWGFAGDTNSQMYIYYFEHDVPITISDKIIEPVVDSDGNPVTPYSIDEKYSVVFVEKKKGDFGRIEYIEVLAEKQLN